LFSGVSVRIRHTSKISEVFRIKPVFQKIQQKFQKKLKTFRNFNPKFRTFNRKNSENFNQKFRKFWLKFLKLLFKKVEAMVEIPEEGGKKWLKVVKKWRLTSCCPSTTDGQ